MSDWVSFCSDLTLNHLFLNWGNHEHHTANLRWRGSSRNRETRKSTEDLSCRIPLQCTFTIPNDGHKTRVTIETRSENLMHGTSESGIRLYLEKDHEIDGPLNAQRILKFVRDNLWGIEPRDVSVEYGPNPNIEITSLERVQKIIEDCLNEN